MGVILWYQVEFPELGLKLSNDVRSGTHLVDAEISVTYGLGEPGSFRIHCTDLPLAAHRKLTAALGEKKDPDEGVAVVIRLGYLDDPAGQREVLAGRVNAIKSATRFPPLGILLTGYEKASFRLLTKVDVNNEGTQPTLASISLPCVSPAEAAKRIVTNAGLRLAGEAGPDDFQLDSLTVEAQNAFALLDTIANRFGAELLVQDGTVQFGKAITYPPESGLPSIPDPAAIVSLLGGEDSLILIKSMTSARLAEFTPVHLGRGGTARIVTDLPDQPAVAAFDFTVLGLPALRAGQRVAVGVQGYENPFEGFRVLQLTHSFSPRTGYTCAGRAVALKETGNRRISELARRASAQAVAERIAGKIQDTLAVAPSVDVGSIRSVKPADRVASLDYGQEKTEAFASPSVDVPITGGQPFLPDKPVASPFAWHHVGLSVPVYEGMRALLNQVRDRRDDSVVTGFLWANDGKMDRPKSRAHDWWLCLPTKLSVGSNPTPVGKGVNDLTAEDGRRVVEAIGLKIAVGQDLCSPVGERPTEGDADVFLLTHKSGTSLHIDSGGDITITAGAQKVELASAGVTLTIGERKVTLAGGGVTLTLGEGKVAIS